MFATWIVLGVFTNLFIFIEDHSPDNSIKKKYAKRAGICCMCIGITGAVILILYILGWLWYYFCGGFLIWEDQPFWDKIACGIISLIPFGFLIGFIMICFGWDPDKKQSINKK